MTCKRCEHPTTGSTVSPTSLTPQGICPDLVGFGRSDKPTRREDHSYARHVEWMRAVAFDVLDLHNAIFQRQMRGAQGIDHPVIRGAGHFVQEDAGAEQAGHIVEFLRH